MLNTTKLFSGFRNSELDLPIGMKVTLQIAKAQVRQHIRTHLPTELANEFKKRQGTDVKVDAPKFRTQGSWAHKTINMPAHEMQQLDIDDGCYVPVSVFEEFANPTVGSDLFFRAMDLVLEALCDEKGWKFDSSNPSCVRLVINNNAHIDVPLYATPEDTYQILEAKALAVNASFSDAFLLESMPKWSLLETDQVLLATRNTGWKKSDPGPISVWVQSTKEIHGTRFTHIVRYVKAWRDHQWEAGEGPSSISLMVAIEACLCSVPKNINEDQALQMVAQQLPAKFSTPKQINNPDDPNEDLTEKLDRTNQRKEVVQRLRLFAQELSNALNASDPSICNNKLVNVFGSRFPYNPSNITDDIEEEIRSTPARVAPVAPMVPNTKAA